MNSDPAPADRSAHAAPAHPAAEAVAQVPSDARPKLALVGPGFDRAAFEGAHVAFGVFDGLHPGHCSLFDAIAVCKREDGGRAVALTFAPDPDEVCGPGPVRHLDDAATRLTRMCRAGADVVAVLPFGPELAALGADEFLAWCFADAKPASLHVGRDFRFGSHASGDVSSLGEWCAARGCALVVHEERKLDGARISSSRVRDAVEAGDVEAAARLLGRPHELTGTVVHGRALGRELGVPTANVVAAEGLVLPAPGVYAGFVTGDVLGGEAVPAAVSVGPAPTVEAGEGRTANPRIVEAHLIGYEGDLYGQLLTVSFVKRRRGMVKFSGLDELVSAMREDLAWCSEVLAGQAGTTAGQAGAPTE